MSLFLKTIFVALLLISYPTFAQNIENDITIKIEGMTCEACVQTLTKVFNKEKSVKSINVNLETQSLIIDEKTGTNLSDDKIKEVIDWGGYELISIQRS